MAVFHGWIYYTDKDDGSTLWRMMVDGTGKMRLNSDQTGVFEPVYEGVYYINETDGDSLYGIAPDGSGRKRICRDKIGTFFADMSKLFYVNRGDGDRIYVIGTDGKGRSRLGTARIGPDDAMRLTYAGSYVYFGRYRIITDGTGLEIVSW
jgi:outer membrane protein assembly factor BamB